MKRARQRVQHAPNEETQGQATHAPATDYELQRPTQPTTKLVLRKPDSNNKKSGFAGALEGPLAQLDSA
jgi:hypothetical protein